MERGRLNLEGQVKGEPLAEPHAKPPLLTGLSSHPWLSSIVWEMSPLKFKLVSELVRSSTGTENHASAKVSPWQGFGGLSWLLMACTLYSLDHFCWER